MFKVNDPVQIYWRGGSRLGTGTVVSVVHGVAVSWLDAGVVRISTFGPRGGGHPDYLLRPYTAEDRKRDEWRQRRSELMQEITAIYQRVMPSRMTIEELEAYRAALKPFAEVGDGC